MAHDAIKSKLDEIRKKAAKAFEEENPDPPEKLGPEIEMILNVGSPAEKVHHLPSFLHWKKKELSLTYRERKRYLNLDKAGKIEFLNKKWEDSNGKYGRRLEDG